MFKNCKQGGGFLFRSCFAGHCTACQPQSTQLTHTHSHSLTHTQKTIRKDSVATRVRPRHPPRFHPRPPLYTLFIVKPLHIKNPRNKRYHVLLLCATSDYIRAGLRVEEEEFLQVHSLHNSVWSTRNIPSVRFHDWISVYGRPGFRHNDREGGEIHNIYFMYVTLQLLTPPLSPPPLRTRFKNFAGRYRIQAFPARGHDNIRVPCSGRRGRSAESH